MNQMVLDYDSESSFKSVCGETASRVLKFFNKFYVEVYLSVTDEYQDSRQISVSAIPRINAHGPFERSDFCAADVAHTLSHLHDVGFVERSLVQREGCTLVAFKACYRRKSQVEMLASLDLTTPSTASSN